MRDTSRVGGGGRERDDSLPGGLGPREDEKVDPRPGEGADPGESEHRRASGCVGKLRRCPGMSGPEWKLLSVNITACQPRHLPGPSSAICWMVGPTEPELSGWQQIQLQD